MDWIQQWQSKLNKQNGVAPLVRTGGSRHTGLAAPPHRSIQSHFTEIAYFVLDDLSISVGLFVKTLPHLRCVAVFTNVSAEIMIWYAQK